MKITIQRGELKAAVSGFQKIVNGKSRSLPILGGIRFEHKADALTALATDLDQFLVYAFQQAQADGDGVMILPLAVLKDLAKGRDGETVELAGASGPEWTVGITNHVGGHALQRSVPGFDPAEWPASPPTTLTRPAPGFMKAFRGMLPFVSHDETRRVLTGVFIEAGTGNACTLVATDGRRLTCSRNLELPVTLSAVVPATKFLAWGGLGDEAQIGMRTEKDGKTVRVAGFVLQAGSWNYDTRTIEGVYPNWRQVVPSRENLTRRLVFHEDDVGLMRRALPSLPGGENVNIACGQDGSVTLSGVDKETGEEPQLPLPGSRYAGPATRICLNRQFLQEALDAGFREFGFADSHAPLMAEDGKGGLHVLMPLRISNDASTPEPVPDTPAVTVNPTPAAETQPATHKEKPIMANEKNEHTHSETSALEKLQAAYDIAKSKVREAQSALADVASAIRDAVREDRQRRSEVETVRAGLARLQAIKV